MASENTKEIQFKMNVTNKIDTFVLFKESEEMPFVKICMPSIPAKVLNDTITKNSYLILPRITSQVIIIVKRGGVYTNLTFFIMTIFRCRSLLTNCVLFIRRNFHYVSF